MDIKKTNYLLRSLMFVPGHNEKLLQSAAKSNADVLLPDLEDSVQPESFKETARKTIYKYISEKALGNHLIFPRVNDRKSGHLLDDLMALTIDGVDGFMYPNAKDEGDIFFICKLLETIEYKKNLPVGHFKLIPLIETSSAVLNAEKICQASSRVIAIAFGCEDFIKDIGGIHDKEGDSLFTARAMIAMAARANGVIPVDTVHVNVHDLPDLEENLKVARKLGFEGMLVLNPKELPLVHRYFSPSEEEVAEAHTTLEAAEQAQKEGRGVAIIDGKFIGPPMIATAKSILEKDKLIKARNV